MKIIDKINQNLKDEKIFYSFEYFPPKSQLGTENLIERIDRMNSDLNPLFVDITWGAGGRTSDTSLFLASYIQNYLHIDVLLHITCKCQSLEKINFALENAKKNNIKNLLILRGDPPQGQEDYDFSNDPFKYADEMVKYVREVYKDFFCICVAGYPSMHFESKSLEDDLFYLKKKVDAGADFIITQLFYDSNEYLTYVENVKKAGITCPILPGILPVNNFNSFNKIINLCKISVPEVMQKEIEEIKNDEEKVKQMGIKYAINLVNELMNKNVKGFHFYTMNLEVSVSTIVKELGILREKEKKEFPWKPRKQNSDVVDVKKQETVRPIFWANNEKSYISKTFYWDEFPNGIWGDSRSPAFGNNEEHLHAFIDVFFKSNNNHESLKKVWGLKVENYNDLSNLFIKFLEGKIKHIPWCEGFEIQKETSSIKSLLLKMNKKQLFTINSQPNVNGVKSDDPIFGWGPLKGYVYQKMYVEFFISKENLLKLIEIIPDEITYQAISKDGNEYKNFKENIVVGLTWGIFPNKEIIQPTIYDSEIFKFWKDEVFSKFNDWMKIYDKEEEKDSLNFLKKSRDELYLMTLIDNDYVTNQLENLLEKFTNSI